MITDADKAKLAKYFASEDWARFEALSEEELERFATSDPENPEWTSEELAEAVERRRRRLSRDAAE
jgi:hypothetical protein